VKLLLALTDSAIHRPRPELLPGGELGDHHLAMPLGKRGAAAPRSCSSPEVVNKRQFISRAIVVAEVR
jgi:hypothetical protein